MKRREAGMLGEKLARDYLQEHGYRILQTNYRCSEGEIDIIAEYQDSLVFVEVRTKQSREFGSPEESITPAKMAKLRKTVARYLQSQGNLPAAWRIDVLAIELGSDNKAKRLELIEDAVGEG